MHISNVVRSLKLEGTSLLDAGLRRPGYELEKITGEIAWYEEQAGQSARLALQYKLEIGKRLVRAKELLPHGHFLAWAQQEFGWTPRHVQNHMRLAENANRVSSLPSGASLRMALTAIRKSEPVLVNEAIEAAPQPVERIHLIGEIEEGSLDRERFLTEVARVAAELGARKTRWKAR